MSVLRVDKDDASFGYYQIFTGPEGSRWQFFEGDESSDVGEWRPTVAAAYRDAAADWESNGNSSNRRLAGHLRAAATRAEKHA